MARKYDIGDWVRIGENIEPNDGVWEGDIGVVVDYLDTTHEYVIDRPYRQDENRYIQNSVHDGWIAYDTEISPVDVKCIGYLPGDVPCKIYERVV